MLALAPKSDKSYDRDRRVMQQAWVGSAVLLVVLGYIGWQISQPKIYNPKGHPGPPPNWGNPPLYPGAQAVSTQTGNPCLDSPQNPIVSGIKGHFAPTQEILFYVPAPAATVEEWYRSQLSGEGWVYYPEIEVGDIMPRTIHEGFWHYGWYLNTEIFGPHYMMDMQAAASANGLTRVDILLADGGENCWMRQ